MQYFGISPLLPGTGANNMDGDWDGDGMSNHDEFLLGTDPTNPLSCFHVRVELTSQTGINIHFAYLPYCNYFISTSDDLVNWTNTVIEEFSFDLNGQAVWSQTTSASGGQKFYRLLVQPTGN